MCIVISYKYTESLYMYFILYVYARLRDSYSIFIVFNLKIFYFKYIFKSLNHYLVYSSLLIFNY